MNRRIMAVVSVAAMSAVVIASDAPEDDRFRDAAQRPESSCGCSWSRA